jgi:hypothetical protein
MIAGSDRGSSMQSITESSAAIALSLVILSGIELKPKNCAMSCASFDSS